jgi:hypothetical protein
MREPVVLILDPDSVYGANLIDYYYTEHGLRCVLGFTGRRARVLAFTTVPAAHSRAVAARVDLTGDVNKDHHDLSRRFDIRAVPAYQELWVEYATAFMHLLGLHWNPPEVVARFRDKFALKQWIRDHAPDVRMNASRMVGSVREVLDEPGSPYRRFVLKPPDGVGNENVLIVDDSVDPQRIARHFAEAVAPGGACVMEEYIDGEEYYVDGQVDAEGNVTPIAVQHYRRGRVGDRSNIALGHVTVRPGELHFDAILEYASHVIAATGLRRSPFHMEVKVDESGPCLIECGARLVGWAAALEDSAAHGPQLDVVRVAAHYWLSCDHIDIPLDFEHYRSRYGLHVIGNSTESGVTVQTSGVAQVESMPAFFRWVLRPRVGREVVPTVSTETIVWGLHLAHRDEAEVVRTAKWASEHLVVELAPATAMRARVAQARSVADHARQALRSAYEGRRMYR